VPDAFETLLAAYEPEVRERARASRALVRRLVPDAEEKVHRAWKTVAYGRSKKFCAISPHKSWVNLQFHRGKALPDPSGLLEGTGRSMRHVKLASAKDLRRRGVAALIRAAAEEAR
jgi:hypothetical protein